MINASLLSYLAAFKCSISIISLVNVLCANQLVPKAHTQAHHHLHLTTAALLELQKKIILSKIRMLQQLTHAYFCV